MRQIEKHVEDTEDEIYIIKQMLTQSKSLEERDAMNKKLKETEERLWKIKVKILQVVNY